MQSEGGILIECNCGPEGFNPKFGLEGLSLQTQATRLQSKMLNSKHALACLAARCINPPLKDGLLGSFRFESQMYCSLAQGVVLKGMLFALGLYFSSPNGVIGPAWPDILGGVGARGEGVSISRVLVL